MCAAGYLLPSASKPEQDHSVIDLTGTDEDKELSLALQASLEPQGSGTTFGPSDRAPNANWAMVPSNVSPERSQYLNQGNKFVCVGGSPSGYFTR